MTLVQDGKVSFVNDEVINVKANPLSATASSNQKDFTFDVEICGKTVTLTWDTKERALFWARQRQGYLSETKGNRQRWRLLGRLL